MESIVTLTRAILLCFLSGLFFSCRQIPTELTDEDMRTEIRQWWGAKIFEGVVIEDTVRVGKRYEVYARMVVCFDTLERMKYEFKKFRKGWRVYEGPVGGKKKKEMIRKMLQIPLNTAKNNIVMSNMKDLQRALMQYASDDEGKFPVDFYAKTHLVMYSVRELLGSHLRNPYIQGAPAVMLAKGDSSEWFPEYEGNAIYFPLDIDFDGLFASGFIIRGSSDRGFLKCVMRSR